MPPMDLMQLLDAAETDAAEAPAAPTPEAKPDATPEPKAEAKAPEAKPAPKEPAAPPAPSDADEALFTDEALAKPEGIKAAREALRNSRRDFAQQRDRKVIELKQRGERLKKQQAKFADEQRAADAKEAARIKRRDAGTPSELLDALGEWYGTGDGIKALEMLNLAAAGKRPAEDKVAKLEKEIADLKAGKSKETEAAEAAQRQRIIAERSHDLMTLARELPHAKLYIEDEPHDAVQRLLRFKIEAHESGKPITDEAAAAKLDEWCGKIAKRFGAPGQAGSGKAEKLGTEPTKSLTSTQVAADSPDRALSWDEYLTDERAKEILADLF